MLHLNGLRVRCVCKEASSFAVSILKKLDVTRAGRTLLAALYFPKVGMCGSGKIGIFDRKGCGGQTEGSYRINESSIAYWYRKSSITINGLFARG